MHQQLLEKSVSYRSWHSNPRHIFFHWFIFVFVLAFISTQIFVSFYTNSKYEQKAYGLFSVSQANAAAVSIDAVGPSSAGISCTGCLALTWNHTISGSNTLLTVGVKVGD